jgi:hypothetical protein
MMNDEFVNHLYPLSIFIKNDCKGVAYSSLIIHLSSLIIHLSSFISHHLSLNYDSPKNTRAYSRPFYTHAR